MWSSKIIGNVIIRLTVDNIHLNDKTNRKHNKAMRAGGDLDGFSRSAERPPKRSWCGVMADVFERLEYLVGRFNWATLGLFKWSLVVILAVMTGVVVVSVFCRYVLNDALPWSEEIAKFLMVWLTFMAAPVGLSRGAHVAIEAISGNLKGRARQALLAIIFMLVIWLMVVFVDAGSFLTWNARIQRHSTVDLSILYVYVAMPIGCAAVAVVALEYLLGAIKGVFDPSRVKERSTDLPMAE
ncbi:MAG: hypothetical protein CMM23_16015 [Rhodospirillaceae bacterium]|nr:hypothetical protein [Rhodospirillaceae bacterium]